VMARTMAVLNGATPAQSLTKYPGPQQAYASSSNPASAGTNTSTQPSSSSTGGTPAPPPAGAEASGMLLNYLLGN
jgi:hypothetical protein